MIRLKQRQDHVDRMKKIKHRKPGSSPTIDCTAPQLLDPTITENRKAGRKALNGLIIERENKALLQRMSTILTEPVKDTVKDYEEMKKLIVPRSLGNSNSYEKFMEKKRNDKFLRVLKNLKPIYSAKRWEKEYEHQKHQQRFMREVSYVRPPGFIDRFAPPEKPTETVVRKERSPDAWIRSIVVAIAMHSVTLAKKHPRRDIHTSAHVNRVRAVRDEHMRSRSIDYGETSFDDFENYGADDNHPTIEVSITADDDFYSNEYEEENEGSEVEQREEVRELLSGTLREIRVSEEIVNDSSDEEGRFSYYAANAEVQCWLVDSELVVFTAAVAMKDGRNVFAEAEIGIEDLAILKREESSVSFSDNALLEDESNMLGMWQSHQSSTDTPKSLLNDMSTLYSITAEMVQLVELRLDLESGARLILNLVQEDDSIPNPLNVPLTLGMSDLDNDDSNRTDDDALIRGLFRQSFVIDEEVEKMLIEDGKTPVLSMGLKLPVKFDGSTSNIELDDVQMKKDFVYVLLKAICTEDDQMMISAHVTTNSSSKFKRIAKPVIAKGAMLQLVTSLPSVIQADPELMQTFALNLAKNIKISYFNGKNELMIDDI